STTEPTYEDVTLTVSATDSHSGVRGIYDSNHEWHEADEILYVVEQSGTYSFIVEDKAGNKTIEQIVVTNIEKIITFQQPTIAQMNDITIYDQATIHATNVTPIVIKDWRNNDNKWRLNVAASKLKM